MRASVLCGALLVALCAGCGREAAEPTPGTAPGEATARADAEPIAPAAVLKAPSSLELTRQCPFVGATKDTIRGLLERGEFEALDALSQRTFDAYRQSFACEPYVSGLFEYLQSFDFALLDRWVAGRPDSWTAATTRAGKWVNTGYARRGTRFAKDVTEEEWAGMREAFARAGSDLERAVQLEPNVFMAYAHAIRLFQASGGERDWRPWLDALLARDPANFTVRWTALEALAPNWGGSLAAMRAFAEDAQRFADRNPKLRKLLGNADVQQGHALRLEGRYAEAEVLFRTALTHGDDHDWYDDLAICLQATRQWQALLHVSDEWIAALDQIGAYIWRGIALFQLGRPEEALASYEVALRVDAENARTLELRATVLRRLGRFGDAAADLRHALALHYNGWSVTQLAEIAAEDASTARQSAELARGLVAANPTYHEAWFLLGSALHASGDAQASAALERYVALAQADGSESTRLAQARRLLHPPPPGGRTLPALAYVGLAHPKP